MKKYLILALSLAMILLIFPTAAIEQSEKPNQTDRGEKRTESSDVQKEEPADLQEDEEVISVFRSTSGKVEDIDVEEYLCGAVAAEISPEYSEEAIKAQTVACHTYALYMREIQKRAPDENLYGADLSDSPNTHQGYMSEEEQKEKWGDKYGEYSEKIMSCVKEVSNKVITYKGEYIAAAFHAINTGKTEDSENVWGEKITYLKSVESPGDALSPELVKTKSLTEEEMKKALGEGDVNVTGEASRWFSQPEYTKSGSVKTVEICGTEYKGSAVRDILSLPSNAFSVRYEDGTFTVETKGYGHMIGLSQCGAEYMAKQGFTWEEILLHYYSGVKITKL